MHVCIFDESGDTFGVVTIRNVECKEHTLTIKKAVDYLPSGTDMNIILVLAFLVVC